MLMMLNQFWATVLFLRWCVGSLLLSFRLFTSLSIVIVMVLYPYGHLCDVSFDSSGTSCLCCLVLGSQCGRRVCMLLMLLLQGEGVLRLWLPRPSRRRRGVFRIDGCSPKARRCRFRLGLRRFQFPSGPLPGLHRPSGGFSCVCVACGGEWFMVYPRAHRC